MRKNVIALLLSIVLAAGSIGTAPVYAAETTAEEAVAVEEEADPEEAVPEEIEDSDTGITAETVTEDETIIVEEMPAQENKDITEVEETAEEQYESDDDAETTEMAEEVEESVTESSEEGDTSSEIAEIVELEKIEEEVIAVEANEAMSATSGKCGTNATWSISGTTLTISGSGAMQDFYYSETVDWYYPPDDEDDPGWEEGEVDCNIPWRENIITRVIIKDGVTSIGKYAFFHLGGLKSITIPSSVVKIGDYAFSGCINLPSITIPSKATSIGTESFKDCKSLTSIKIPNGVKGIGNRAFYGCSGLTNITIPDSVTSLGYGAFSGCLSLTSINIPNRVESIKKSTFYGCKSLTGVTIPDGVTSIGESAFYRCSGIINIKVPASVSSIGKSAFYGCSSLTEFVISDNVTSIATETFSKCSGLKNITIPSSVTGIGVDAFSGCDSLNILFSGSEEQWKKISRSNAVNYKTITFGVVSSTFSVNAKFELEKQAFNYTGNPIKPSVTVTYNGKQLVQGKDYKLAYKNNTDLGMATVNVNGIGKYSGTAQLQFKIRIGNTPKITCTNVASGMKVSWVEVSGATRYKVYRDGKLIFTTSALVVTDKDVKYKGGTKFVYKVVATEKNTGDSDLFKTATYYRLMPVGIKSLTNPSAGKMTVTYDRSTGSSGYVVRYGLKSDMSDAKVITVQGEKTLSRTFGGMQKGKTYYVQVRTYKIENGIRYYSGYCTTKKITIKK